MEMVSLNANQMTLSGSLSSSTLSNNMTIDSKTSFLKVRKAYTMTKSRESWTNEEHDKFLEGLQLFDRYWKKIKAFVGSKTVVQIRSHAQKYFLKVQKSWTGQHVPSPCPKRKVVHHYPHKASKTATIVSQISYPFRPSGAVLDDGYVCMPQSISLPGPSYEVGMSWPVMTQNCSSNSSSESNQRGCTASEINDQGTVKLLGTERVLPDFAQVYRFIGSVFDPNANGHLQKLKSMDPINFEMILLLVKNLTINLMNPEFQNHKKMICSYDDEYKTLWLS